MRLWRARVVVAAATLACCHWSGADVVVDLDAQPQALVLANGHVFDGVQFVRGDLAIDGGVFVADAPAGARVIDCTDWYLTPPLADAHTHRFNNQYDAPQSRTLFLSGGFFSALVAANASDSRAQCGEAINGPTGVDVVFANGGFTAPGGHPVRLQERLHARHYPAETFLDRAADNLFYLVHDRPSLRAKAELHAATEPDLTKVFLLHSEEFELRRDDERFYGSKGIDPSLVEPLVQLSLQRGLRVAAHVETRADYRAAVSAGVSIIAHTPGYNIPESAEPERFRLTSADARAGAANGVIHVTTASLARDAVAREVVRQNLQTLRDAGATIVLGSDQYRSPQLEITALAGLGVFSNLELLQMATLATAAAIHNLPDAPSLEPGTRARVIGFRSSPLADPAALLTPELAVKDGAVLYAPS